jgi:hypothetical protein
VEQAGDRERFMVSYRHGRADVVKVPEVHPRVMLLVVHIRHLLLVGRGVWRLVVVEEPQPHDGAVVVHVEDHVVVAGGRRVLVGEVDLGLGPPDASRGAVVGARGGLGGGEGAEPDARALGGVADLCRPLAPRPPPDAAVHRLALALPRRLCKLKQQQPMEGGQVRGGDIYTPTSVVDGRSEGRRDVTVPWWSATGYDPPARSASGQNSAAQRPRLLPPAAGRCGMYSEMIAPPHMMVEL